MCDLYYYRSPGVVERELNECKEYMERVEQHTGRFEEISVAYHERKAKYEQILGDMKHLEDGLSVCRKFLSSIMQTVSLM
jgi:hypothetical protein